MSTEKCATHKRLVKVFLILSMSLYFQHSSKTQVTKATKQKKDKAFLQPHRELYVSYL